MRGRSPYQYMYGKPKGCLYESMPLSSPGGGAVLLYESPSVPGELTLQARAARSAPERALQTPPSKRPAACHPRPNNIHAPHGSNDDVRLRDVAWSHCWESTKKTTAAGVDRPQCPFVLCMHIARCM